MGAKVYESANLRNLALTGHGFCGKTSLGEAILFNAGATTRLGKTEAGTSTFDYEPEEQKRGGSLASSFAWVEYRGKKINIVDTPGDQNFLYDGFNALDGADCAVVMVSAPDGVEVQTERFWNRAVEKGLPRIVFINKMDRERANWKSCLDEVAEIFNVKPLLIQVPIGQEHGFKGVVDLFAMKALTWATDGSGVVTEGEIPADLAGEVDSARETLVEDIASTDDDLLEQYMETFELAADDMLAAFRKAFAAGTIVPVLFGASAHNMCVQPLMDLVAEYGPQPGALPALEGEALDGEPIMVERGEGAFVGKVIRTFIDEFSGQVNIVRVYAGSTPADGIVYNSRTGENERLGTIHIQKGKEREPIDAGVPGDIISVAKLKDTRTNDTLSDLKAKVKLPAVVYPKPMMSYAIRPVSRGDEDRIKVAVERLIIEDPTITVSYDEIANAMVLNGMGNAHLEAAIEKMKRKFKVTVTTDLPAVPYRETIAKAVKNVEGKHKKQTGGAGQFGVCFINVVPQPRDAGFEFADMIVGGRIPRQFIPSVEKGVIERMKRGALAGYPVVDLKVELIDGKYHPVDSKDVAFQMAGSKGLKAAMEKAGMKILEPYYAMEIMVPSEAMGDIMGDITGRRGRVLGMEPHGKRTIIKAVCPLAEIQRYAPDLRSMTGGKGSFTMTFSGYEDVPTHLVDKIRADSPFAVQEEED
ncbi:MAG: elongation factor G [Pseudomonadota bacterium]